MPLIRLLSALILLCAARSYSEDTSTLAERLGYPSDAILLIVHGDDLGLSHSQNAATFQALEEGCVNSGSIMMNAPWVTEVLHYLRDRPRADFGIHLTLTAEWETYKWGPVAPIDQVRSLVDEHGYFYPSTGAFVEAADPSEVELELHAQIQLAQAMGIDFTHFDTHMGAASATPELFEIYTRLAREYQVPLRLRPAMGEDPAYARHLRPETILPESVQGVPSSAYPDSMAAAYREMLENLGPGLHEIVLHLAFDDAESQAIMVNHPLWGARWRQIDYDFFTSDECSRIIAQRSIQLVTWREIRDTILRGR